MTGALCSGSMGSPKCKKNNHHLKGLGSSRGHLTRKKNTIQRSRRDILEGLKKKTLRGGEKKEAACKNGRNFSFPLTSLTFSFFKTRFSFDQAEGMKRWFWIFCYYRVNWENEKWRGREKERELIRGKVKREKIGQERECGDGRKKIRRGKAVVRFDTFLEIRASFFTRLHGSCACQKYVVHRDRKANVKSFVQVCRQANVVPL